MSSAPTDRIEYTSSWRTREGCFAFPSRLRTAELSTANADLLASNRELEAFSYSVSHDPRAPLRSISGFSQIVLEDYGQEIDETGKTYLRRIVIARHRGRVWAEAAEGSGAAFFFTLPSA